jgi:hypothetical protein
VALIADASVNSARSSTNFGGLSNLYIGNGSTTFLRFDLGTLPADTSASQIARATLTVFVNRVNVAGSVSVSPVTSAWTESGVTDETIPTIGAATSTFTASTAGQFITLDVTALVQGWLTTPATDFGFALNSASANLLLDSKENDETGHAASLEITINSEGATGLQGLQGIQGSVGPVGPQGLLGLSGLHGPQGVQGIAGPVGPIGLIGTPGVPGVSGTPGAIGAVGPAGTPGTAGTIGATGAAGAPGPFVGGNYSTSVDYPSGSVVENASSTYLAVQTNGPSTTAITPGTNSAYWVATTGSGTGTTTLASYIDETTTQSFSISPGQAVFEFDPNISTNSGFFASPNGGTVFVTAAGTYTYDYNISNPSGVSGALSLTDNGILIPNTTFGTMSGTSQIIGHGVITLNAGALVQLIAATLSGPLELQGSTPGQTVAAFSLVAMAAGAPGAAGATGATGANGAAGAIGRIGPAGSNGANGAIGAMGTFSAAGNWASATTYQVGQVVFCAACSTNGSSYIAIATNTNQDPPTQTAVWNLVAQAGATGTTGINGTNGLSGATGAAGSAGAAGSPGATGVAGATGTTGPQGPVGAQGITGANGATGAAGATGSLPQITAYSSATTYAQGSAVVYQGSTYQSVSNANLNNLPTNTTFWTLIAQAGATGVAGATGATGVIGATGATGPQGLVGAQGISGTNGAAGAIGAAGYLPQVTAYSSAMVYAQGSAVVYQGSTYQSIATSLNNLPTNTTFWTLLAQAGATGVAGATGATGVAGVTGATGPQGPVGAQGISGANGATGATGATGSLPQVTGYSAATTYAQGSAVVYQGSTYQSIATSLNNLPTNTTFWTLLAQAGATGSVGITGSAGSNGAAGTNGVPGAAGANGATGAIGATGAVGATGSPGPFVGGNYSAAINYPAGSVVDYASSTYLAVQTNGPSTNAITPGSDSAYWVATSGSASGSTASASYIDVSETVASATVAIGAEVFAATSAPSPLVASNSGFTFNSTAGTVTVAVAGTYTYDYDVSVAEPGVLALTDNGVFVPGTSFGRSTGTTQIIGHGQIALNAGDVVGLISDDSAAALTLYAITTFQNIAAFSLVAITTGTPGSSGPQGPQGVTGANGLPGTDGTGTVDSIAVGTVTTSGYIGTVSIGGAAINPTININFPASSGSSAGFVWTTSFQVSTDVGPDNVNPLTGAIGIVPTSGTQMPEFAFAPVACTATSLQVYAAEVGPLYLQAAITVTAQDNGTNTSMSCQLTPSQGSLPASSCSSTNTFSINAGDEIQYSLTQISPPPPGTSSFGQIGTTLTCQNQ